MTQKGGYRRRLPRVALLTEMDDSWGRGIARAVVEYAYRVGWEVTLSPRDSQGLLRMSQPDICDGIIALIRDKSLLRHVQKSGKPTVNLSGMFLESEGLCNVYTDDATRAEMALEHFRSRNISSFACYSPSIRRYPETRANLFCQAVRQGGWHCFEYCNAPEGRDSEWLPEGAEVAEWLRTLPSPVGIFAPDPYPARHLTEVASECGLNIPSDLLVVSGDDDDVLCKWLSPSLTSIETASSKIGEEACKQIGSMMNSGCQSQETVLVPPQRVVPRYSTGGFSVVDPVVAACFKKIRDVPPDSLSVGLLVSEASMSRRALELRFLRCVGRSPAEVIRRARLEEARQQIVTSDKSIEQIAVSCGLSSGPYLAMLFRKYFKIKPSTLRESAVHAGASANCFPYAASRFDDLNL